MTFNISKRRAFVLFLITFVTFLSIHPVSDWIATHWLISYDTEFVKRGLPGTILQHVTSLPVSIATVTFISNVIYLILSITLTLYVLKALPNNSTAAALLVCSGIGIQQFGYDIGRYDQISLILTILSLFAIQYKINPFGKTWLIPAFFSTLSMLIHEASALISVPIVFSALIIKNLSTGTEDKSYITYIFISLFAFLLVVSNGKVDTMSLLEWGINISAKADDFQAVENSYMVSKNTLSENVQITLEKLLSEKTISRFIRLAIFALPIFYTLYLIFKGTQKEEKGRKRFLKASLLLLPVASTFPLYLLGIDFYRWVSIGTLNFLLILCFYRYITNTNHEALNFSRKHHLMLFLSIVYTGPFGISIATPDRMGLVKSLISIF